MGFPPTARHKRHMQAQTKQIPFATRQPNHLADRVVGHFDVIQHGTLILLHQWTHFGIMTMACGCGMGALS